MSLTDVETLFIPIHGADDDGNLYLSAAWDVVLQELDPVNCANDGKYSSPRGYSADGSRRRFR